MSDHNQIITFKPFLGQFKTEVMPCLWNDASLSQTLLGIIYICMIEGEGIWGFKILSLLPVFLERVKKRHKYIKKRKSPWVASLHKYKKIWTVHQLCPSKMAWLDAFGANSSKDLLRWTTPWGAPPTTTYLQRHFSMFAFASPVGTMKWRKPQQNWSHI